MNDNHPFFSIVLPTYNRSSFISKAIESVINQTYKNWELIIIDDGSTDNTNEVVNKFIQKDHRIKYFYQQNSERSIARNNGIKKSKANWICFLDSDDLYHFNHLEIFYNFISQHQFKKGLFFSGVSFGKYDEKEQFYDDSGNNNLEFILLNSIGVPRSCCHKDILLGNPFDKNINIGEDKELWSRVVLNYPMYYHKYKSFIEIEHDKRSISLATSIDNRKTFKKILNSKEIRKKVNRKVVNICYSRLYFDIGRYKLEKNNKLSAIIYFIISLILDMRKFKFCINIIFHILKKKSISKIVYD